MLEFVQTIQPVQNDVLTSIISQYFRIDDTTWGDDKAGYLVRYRGSLYSQDSAAAYDQLAHALHDHYVTPLFRIEENQQVIRLIKGIIQPKPTKIWGNILFFFLTVISVTFAGAYFFSNSNIPSNITGWFQFMVGGLHSRFL